MTPLLLTSEQVWIDAYDESNRITASEAKSKVRRMIGGLRKHGLKLNDSVCVHSYNNVWLRSSLLIPAHSNPSLLPATDVVPDRLFGDHRDWRSVRRI